MSSNWGYLTMRFLHANLMYRILLPVHHLNVSLYANFVHTVHDQADDNLYDHRAPWWHCVPLMQLLEQRTKLQCVPLMSSRGRYSGFLQELLHPSCDWIQGLKALIYSCFSWSLLSEAVTTVYTLIFQPMGPTSVRRVLSWFLGEHSSYLTNIKFCGHLCKVPVIETCRSTKILPTGNIMKLNNCWASILACQWVLIIVEPLPFYISMEILTYCKDIHIHQ